MWRDFAAEPERLVDFKVKTRISCKLLKLWFFKNDVTTFTYLNAFSKLVVEFKNVPNDNCLLMMMQWNQLEIKLRQKGFFYPFTFSLSMRKI